jgi:hypothetical protein
MLPIVLATTLMITSPVGGAYSAGTVYSVDNAGTHDLYDFCPHPEYGCPDGANPISILLPQSDGSYIGATTNGGASVGNGGPDGVIFQLTPNGSGWTETVLWDVCTWFGDCAHRGPVTYIWQTDTNQIDMIIEKSDGSAGEHGRLQFGGQTAFSALKSW